MLCMFVSLLGARRPVRDLVPYGVVSAVAGRGCVHFICVRGCVTKPIRVYLRVHICVGGSRSDLGSIECRIFVLFKLIWL
ncbi:hypothetical protein M6B38_332830 [Iris pallida]|uniref:Secreted protein n=1 Tax=Iris pallida TaxID=29817 RepID=A0AAX6H262_IRIPA|nr:hypothetical protein M6B38_367745 [Iris pallida]KAJ6834854.1 hypothetical protein M6B38_332830 [Iris pallida]